MLLVGVAIVMAGAGFAWVATRGATPAGGSTGQGAPVVQQHEAQPLPVINTNSQSVPVNVGPTAGAAPGKGPNGNDLIQLAGKVGGLLGGESAFTNTAKDLAAPVGIGVTTIAVLAGAGSSLSVAAVWAVPIVLITVAIITIIDGIARTAQNEQWKKGCIAVRDLRAAGQHREALEVYERLAGMMATNEAGQRQRAGGEISEISRRWPQPDEADWYNPLDPLGKPYPGFPGPPAPATLAELAANPGLLPDTITTVDGRAFQVRKLLSDAVQHVYNYRKWALENGIVGELPAYGPPLANRSATDAGRPLLTATKGARDVSKWPDLIEAQRQSAAVLASIASAFPWLAALPVPAIAKHPLDLSAEVAAFKKTNAATEAARRTDIRNDRNFGGQVKGTGAPAKAARAALAAALVKETAAEAAGRKQGGAAAGTTDTAGGTSRSTGPANNSGSGAAGERGAAEGNAGRWAN